MAACGADWSEAGFHAIVMTLQFFFGSLQAGLAVGGTVFACVQAALLLTLTTTVAQLLDTFTVLVSPLRLLRRRAPRRSP
jgi:biotin transport system permease protein